MKAMARTPSHLTSKSHSSPRGMRSAIMAFMGSIDRGHGGELRALEAGEVDDFFLRLAALAAGSARGFAARGRLAGGLVAQTRSDAPAVLRLVLRAGRFCAISSCVRPESTL